MSGLAKYFLQKNIRVSGYDREKSHVTKELNKLGANIIYDSNKLIISEFIDDKKDTLIVYTPAISKSDPILEAFLKNDFKVYKRSEILERISKLGKCIAIAGTHGKTTTTAILAHILKVADLSFCAFVGGIMENYNSNFIYNGEDYILVEADEFDRSFLHLNPSNVLVTNIDNDHMETYGHDEERLKQTFVDFIHQIPFYNEVFLCIDDKNIKSIQKLIARPIITYGFSKKADYYPDRVVIKKIGMNFKCFIPKFNLKKIKFKNNICFRILMFLQFYFLIQSYLEIRSIL